MNDLATRVLFQDGWLQLPPGLPFDAFQSIVERFTDFRKDLMWIVGDFQVQGEALYGEDASQALDLLAGHGYSESTLGVARSVAQRYPLAERRRDVTFEHHKIAMKHPDRAALLDRAAREQMTTAQMRALIAEGVPTRKDGTAESSTAASTPSTVSVLELVIKAEGAWAQFDYTVCEYRRKILHDESTDKTRGRLKDAASALMAILTELETLCA